MRYSTRLGSAKDWPCREAKSKAEALESATEEGESAAEETDAASYLEKAIMNLAKAAFDYIVSMFFAVCTLVLFICSVAVMGFKKVVEVLIYSVTPGNTVPYSRFQQYLKAANVFIALVTCCQVKIFHHAMEGKLKTIRLGEFVLAYSGGVAILIVVSFYMGALMARAGPDFRARMQIGSKMG